MSVRTEKFAERKAPRLLELLEGLDFDDARIEGDRAEFPAEQGRPLIFVKIDGTWYLQN